MRSENKKMQEFLKSQEIACHVKYLVDGSLKGCWRLWGKGQTWTSALWNKLNSIGFSDFDGKMLDQYSGNGGLFSVFARIKKRAMIQI